MLQFHAKLCLRLGHNPHISLKAVIYGVWVGVTRRKSIVDREDGNVELFCPLARVILVRSRVHAHETTAVEMYNRSSDRLSRL
jgi:hypothetical protein